MSAHQFRRHRWTVATPSVQARFGAALRSGWLVPQGYAPQCVQTVQRPWATVDKIAREFDRISPYDSKIIPHLFKKEDVNRNAAKNQVELRYFGIASKSYVCFRRVGNRI